MSEWAKFSPNQKFNLWAKRPEWTERKSRMNWKNFPDELKVYSCEKIELCGYALLSWTVSGVIDGGKRGMLPPLKALGAPLQKVPPFLMKHKYFSWLCCKTVAVMSVNQIHFSKRGICLSRVIFLLSRMDAPLLGFIIMWTISPYSLWRLLVPSFFFG